MRPLPNQQQKAINEMKLRLYFGFILLFTLLVGCRQQATPAADQNLDVQLEFSNSDAVGESNLAITITDAQGQSITDAQVEVRGDMTHAGMTPVIVTAQIGDDGRYHAAFEWTMGGDWIVTVSVRLADGSLVEQTFDYSIAGAMNMDMSDSPMTTPEATAEE